MLDKSDDIPRNKWQNARAKHVTEIMIAVLLIAYSAFMAYYSVQAELMTTDFCQIDRVSCLQLAQNKSTCLKQRLTFNYTDIHGRPHWLSDSASLNNCTYLVDAGNVCYGTFFSVGNMTTCRHWKWLPNRFAVVLSTKVFGKVTLAFVVCFLAMVVGMMLFMLRHLIKLPFQWCYQRWWVSRQNALLKKALSPYQLPSRDEDYDLKTLLQKQSSTISSTSDISDYVFTPSSDDDHDL